MTRSTGQRIVGDHERRFFSKIERVEGGCWLWTRGLNKFGYGLFSEGQTTWLAHRWSYKHFIGPIPEGSEIDHVRARGCRFRRCVNPAHLEAVLHVVNVQRGNGGINMRIKTHCPQRHAYDGDNLRVTPAGRRVCRTCQREAVRQSRLRRLARGELVRR